MRAESDAARGEGLSALEDSTASGPGCNFRGRQTRHQACFGPAGRFGARNALTTTIAFTESEPFLTAVAGQRIPRRAWAQVSEMSGLLSEAVRVLQTAKRQTELLQRRAYFDGRAAGIAHAHAESIKHVLDAERQARELVAASELRIVKLAISIVERIAPRLDQGDLVAALASEGLAAIREERHICLRINSAAEKSVRPMLDRWQGAHPEVETVELVIDPQLDPMACVVETELGRIEVSLPAQLQAVRTILAAAAAEPSE